MRLTVATEMISSNGLGGSTDQVVVAGFLYLVHEKQLANAISRLQKKAAMRTRNGYGAGLCFRNGLVIASYHEHPPRPWSVCGDASS